MHFQESETVELKEVVVADIKKEIIAFANCQGGKLYIGVRDDGEVVGIESPDDVALQISNMVRDTIKPDITLFLHYETIKINNKNIVVIDVQRGTDRPYYLAKKGMRPEGVYVRQGYSSVPATDGAIRKMIKETDGDRFEEMRSLNQNLTFEITKKEFEKRHIDFDIASMRSMKLMDHDGIYNNLALLLSDQCIHTIKVAVFQGKDQTIFKDRREFSGSLMKQMNDVYEFIDFRNQIHSTIDKLMRRDVRDYPEIALREALLNLLVHRDYSFSASAFINIYENRIEFVSVGGLLPGIDLEDVMMGISVCRNQNLANVFYRLQLIEAYGTGMSKIMNAYKDVDEKPIIETTKNAFKIILPNRNSESKIKEETFRYDQVDNYLNKREQKVMEFVQKYGEIVNDDVSKLLGVSTATASRVIRSLVERNLLKKDGKARNTKYTIVK